MRSKLAVVTGGANGIGQQIVEQLVSHGWDVAFNDLKTTPKAQWMEKQLGKEGRRVLFRTCNVSNKDEVEQFYSDVEETFGVAPSLIINNAGIQTWSGILDLEEMDWDRVIETNLKGSFLNTQIGSKLMIKHKVPGCVINIGSGCNSKAFPKLVDYTASKGGVEMLTKVSALELGEHHIRVNCVAPGGIMIERTANECENYSETWAQISALKRVGTPEDIANAILFLASREASFITGQTLYVDGGVSAKSNWPY